MVLPIDFVIPVFGNFGSYLLFIFKVKGSLFNLCKSFLTFG